MNPAGVESVISCANDPVVWPWQAEPFRLWSLLEMQRFFAASFSTAFVDLEGLQSDSILMYPEEGDGEADAPTDEWRERVRIVLRNLEKECKEAGFDRIQARCARLRTTAPDMPMQTACHMFRDLAADLQNELLKHMYFVVPSDRKGWYREDDFPLFGDAVASAIPDSTAEIAEAGRCLALARWTACVFHLMRATELALHKWCDELEVPLKVPAEQANWQDILNGADKHLKTVEQQPKSARRDADLAYFGDTSAHFRAIKDAWRNHVSHSKVTYDERQALSIMQHVRAFMEKLATRPIAR